jgi:hypothetical protein
MDQTPDGADRRDFIKTLATLVAAAGTGLRAQAPGPDQTPAGALVGRPGPAPVPSAGRLIGVQMGPHTMLDEGIEHCLDLIQKTAAIDTIMVYSHAYGGDLKKPLSMLTTDHGVPVKDQQTRNLPLVWVKQHDQYFKDTSLRHPAVDASFDYHDRDLFTEMLRPLRARGMKVYARILESGGHGIVNFSKVVTVNTAGHPTTTGCWNHPEYIAFWRATAEDLFRCYELDGFQWGAERASPLTNVIQNGSANSATCFCEFCRARGKANGIDPERARLGFETLLTFVQGMRAGQLKPESGAAAAFVSIMLRYPEILAWDYQYRHAREAVMRTMYQQVKAIKPTAPVGWHVDHWATSMDLVARSAMSYADMAPWSDYLKVVVYHAVTGPRIRSWVSNVQRSVLKDVPLADALNLHYELFGYDTALMPKLDQPTPSGAWPDYVARETRRSLASAAGKTKIYPGIGFNVPGAEDDPETVYQVTAKAFDAGAQGVVASREYEEMTVPNLEAFGRAVREAAKKAGSAS